MEFRLQSASISFAYLLSHLHVGLQVPRGRARFCFAIREKVDLSTPRALVIGNFLSRFF